jgi:hypothetical protein
VTAQRYPLSACSQPGTQTYPTIRRVPSEAATAGMAQTVRPAVRARGTGLPSGAPDRAPFTLNRHGLVAHPLLYGMILFARMLGPHPQLVGLRLQNLHRFHLKAWAVRTQGKVIHVLLIDKGQHSVRGGLCLPATGPATVQRLHARPCAAHPA